MSNERLRYKHLSGDEKKGLDVCLLNIGDISVVYYSLEDKNQIVVQFQHSDTHMIINQNIEHCVGKGGVTYQDEKFEMKFTPFNKEDYYCHVLKAFANYEDAEVSESEYLSNTKFEHIEDLRVIIATNVKVFLLHILSNQDIVLNQYLKVGQIGHSEHKDILTSHFDLDIKQVKEIEYIRFANNENNKGRSD